MSGSGSIADNDGNWTATFDNGFNWDLSGGNGNTTFDLKSDDGKVEGNATIRGIDVGTDDNHFTFGGGSQTVDGSLKYGTTTLDILGGKFDLGDGRTEKFQLSFTMDPTPLGPRFTGVGTNNLAETKTFEKSSEGPATSYEAKVPPIEQKDLLFDIAGIVIPYSVFVGWTKRLVFSIKVNVEANEKEVKVTMSRDLKLEVRPLFMPFPEFKWPSKPPYPPPFLDPIAKRVPELTTKKITLQAFCKAISDALDEVRKWKSIEELIETVDKWATRVAIATAAVTAATAIAVAFLGLNPAADFAEGAAIATLTTETAEWGASKLTLEAAKKGLTWGAEKISIQVIRTQILPKILASLGAPATGVIAGLSVYQLFESLSKESGLEGADGDLGKMEEALGKMQTSAQSQLQQAEDELKTATEEYNSASDKAHRLVEYQTLLESWGADPAHAPFLTWAKTNLKINDASEDAEAVDLGDISDREKLLSAVAKQEEYAKSKGYTGFVIVLPQAKAYFRTREVEYLLGTLDSEPYAEQMISYVKAERIPMDTLVSRWDAIERRS